MNVIDSIPGDKSISHRAIIIGALVTGASHFKGFLCSEDCLNTLTIFRQLGVSIELSHTDIIVQGRGVKNLTSPNTQLDVGNSGTGTQTLEIATAKENLKTMTINGSFTLAPQTVNSVIAFVTTNDGSGGHTITTSGFDLVSGTYNNAASAKHLMRSTVIDGTQVLEILEIA